MWAAPVLASVSVECPASCTSQAAFDDVTVALEVRCAAKIVELRIDFGEGHVVTREVPATSDGCRSLPEVVRLLTASVLVGRAAERASRDVGSSPATSRVAPTARERGASKEGEVRLPVATGSHERIAMTARSRIDEASVREADGSPTVRSNERVGSGGDAAVDGVGRTASSKHIADSVREGGRGTSGVEPTRETDGSPTVQSSAGDTAVPSMASSSKPITNSVREGRPSESDESSAGDTAVPALASSSKPIANSVREGGRESGTRGVEPSESDVSPTVRSSAGDTSSKPIANSVRDGGRESATAREGGARPPAVQSSEQSSERVPSAGDAAVDGVGPSPASLSEAATPKVDSAMGDLSGTRAARHFLGLDLGGGLQTGALAAVFRARITGSPFAHVGFFVDAALSTQSTTTVGARVAYSVVQQGALGVLLSWRALHLGGPQLALDAGLEHVQATASVTDEGVGVVFGARAEYLQPLPLGWFARASVGVDVRPMPWSVQVAGVTTSAYENLSFIAGLSIGWAPSNVWGW